jgi:phosphoglycerate dehydrogenase-like enzyme
MLHRGGWTKSAARCYKVRESAKLGELLRTADVVSLHVPQTPETANMIGAAQLAATKLGSYLINASGGDVVEARRSRPN